MTEKVQTEKVPIRISGSHLLNLVNRKALGSLAVVAHSGLQRQCLEKISKFDDCKTVLDVSWGNGSPIVSRVGDFPGKHVDEVGLSLNYLFQGNAKAKQLLQDISAIVGEKKYDWIRMSLVAQHVRHHGVFLEGLKPLLKDRGRKRQFSQVSE